MYAANVPYKDFLDSVLFFIIIGIPIEKYAISSMRKNDTGNKLTNFSFKVLISHLVI